MPAASLGDSCSYMNHEFMLRSAVHIEGRLVQRPYNIVPCRYTYRAYLLRMSLPLRLLCIWWSH